MRTRFCRLCRKCEEKSRAHANFAFHPDASPVSFHDFPDDGQSEPRSAFACSAADAGLAEGLKQFSTFALGYSWTLISDRNLHAASLGHCVHSHGCP